MPENIEILANYLPDKLYVNPAQKSRGAYATMLAESEELLGEVDVTPRTKLAVSAFYVSDRGSYDTFKITKLRLHRFYGWRQDGHVQVNAFQLA